MLLESENIAEDAETNKKLLVKAAAAAKEEVED